MEQYISKSALLSEIDWLVNNYDKALDYEAALEDVRDFIDSLEVKESAELQHEDKSCKENGNSLTQEPANEDLEKAAVEAFKQIVDSDKNNFLEIFKAGAKWQAEQFEKNRLAACDRQAEEEAEIERDFVIGIIENEHRQPTFDDAIKYGMRLQKEQMIAKAVDGVVTFDYYGGDKAYGCVAHDSFCLEDCGLKDRDEVKILILKKIKSYD